MDTLPKPFLLHHYPLLGVLEPTEAQPAPPAVTSKNGGAALAPEAPAPKRPALAPYALSIRNQVVKLLSKYPLDAYWDTFNARENLRGFASVTVYEGQYISSKLRYQPGQSLSAIESALASSSARHSGLSPLNPESPLHPDGLVSPQWALRHHQTYPSVLISFHDLRYYGGDNGPESSTDSLADDRIATDLLYNQRLARIRGVRYAAFLILDQHDCDQPGTEDRVTTIRKKGQLDGRHAFTVLRPVTPAQLEEQVNTLARVLLDHAMGYYRELAKQVGRKAAKLVLPAPASSPVTGAATPARAATPSLTAHPLADATADPTPAPALPSPPAEGKQIDAHGLPALGWKVRYQFKLATFAELRQDMTNALKHYYTAYTELIEFLHQIALTGFSDLPSLQMFTRRWEEGKNLLDSLAWKMCKLYLYLDAPAACCELFTGHINAFSSLLSTSGYGDDTSYYWRWMTSQHQNLAVLLDIGSKHGLTFPLPEARLPALTRTPSTLSALGAEFRLPGGFGLDRTSSAPSGVEDETAGVNPATVLQHPGFHYHAAALCSAQHRRRFAEERETLLADAASAPESNVPDGMVPRLYLQNYLLPLRERTPDQFCQATINLLTHAYEGFKRYRSVRNTLYMASEIAETYFEAGNYAMAAKFFERIAKTYRREQWSAILTSTLRWSLHCAIETDSWAGVIRLLVELMAPNVTTSPEEGAEYQAELQRVLDRPAVQVPASTPQDDGEKDTKRDGSAAAASAGEPPVVVDMNAIHPFVTCHVQFRCARTTANRTASAVPYQVVLVASDGALTTPLTLNVVRFEFDRPEYNVVLRHGETAGDNAEAGPNEERTRHTVATEPLYGTPGPVEPWTVDWQRVASETGPTTRDLTLSERTCKVFEGQIRPISAGEVGFRRVVLELGTVHRTLELHYGFDESVPRSISLADNDPYATRSAWWGVLSRNVFGFGRFDRPRWFRTMTDTLERDPRWVDLSYRGPTHRLSVASPTPRAALAYNAEDGPILAREKFALAVTITNGEAESIRGRLTLALHSVDPRATLTRDEVPAVETTGGKNPEPTGPARTVTFDVPMDGTLDATAAHTVVAYLSGSTAAEVMTMKLTFTYDVGADADAPREVQLGFELPVVEPLAAYVTCCPMATPPALSLDDDTEIGSSAPAEPHRYLLTAQLRNTGTVELVCQDLMLVPQSSDSMPPAQVMWSSFARIAGTNSSQSSARTIATSRHETHTFLVSDPAGVLDTSPARRAPDRFARFGTVQIKWRRARWQGLPVSDASDKHNQSTDDAARTWTTTELPINLADLLATGIRIRTECAPMTRPGSPFNVTYHITNHGAHTDNVVLQLTGGTGLTWFGPADPRYQIAAGETIEHIVRCTPLPSNSGWLDLPVASAIVQRRRISSLTANLPRVSAEASSTARSGSPSEPRSPSLLHQSTITTTGRHNSFGSSNYPRPGFDKPHPLAPTSPAMRQTVSELRRGPNSGSNGGGAGRRDSLSTGAPPVPARPGSSAGMLEQSTPLSPGLPPRPEVTSRPRVYVQPS
ncbi:hypothetical protein IWQ60_002802 [Tieghemiomyces parasiticus]|uniref:Trafficking protein particle complex subunit 11 domain-containing protein n=1 Tax=Tieghemiomyces parasiticus TaxID=78921 RepID=A0A9W8AHD4_9FUNG|nr:hypothetical protein IWQ60_002802 [Tieghemiomyces parasiticus]